MERCNCKTHGDNVEAYLLGDRRRCKACIKIAVRKSRQKQKAILVREAGGACVKCGYDKCLRALSFHHLDPALKSHKVMDGIWSLKRSREEAKKCQLLCMNCHMELEDSLLQESQLT